MADSDWANDTCEEPADTSGMQPYIIPDAQVRLLVRDTNKVGVELMLTPKGA